MFLFKKLFKNNKGISLVELVVTIGIMSIVTAGIGAAVVSATRSYSNGSVEVDMQTDAQNLTNIITNLVIDSTECRSTIDGTVATGEALYIRSIPSTSEVTKVVDGTETTVTVTSYTYYALVYDSSSREIKYNKSDESYDKAAEADALLTLATNVDAFATDCSKFNREGNFQVHIDFDMYSTASKRSIQTSFNVASRNAGADNAVIDADGAIIAVNTMMVIEPNQELERNFDVLKSGSIKSKTVNVSASVYTKKYGSASDKLSDTRLQVSTNNDTHKLNFKASDIIDAADDNDEKALYVCLEAKGTDGTVYDTKWVTVYIRKVKTISVVGVKTTGSYQMGRANSAYTITSSFNSTSIYNPDRFYAFPEDNDYIQPYSVIWEITWSSNIANPFDYLTFDSGYNICGLSISKTKGVYVTTDPNTTLKVSLKQDIPMSSYIRFTCYSAHSYGKFGATEYNKTGEQYPKTGAISGYYDIKRSFFDDGYKRGTVKTINHGYQGNKGVEDFVTTVLVNKFGPEFYKTTDADLIAVLKNVYGNDYINNHNNAKEGITFGCFYSIGEDAIDADGNPYIKWTPYRLYLSMSANAQLDTEIAFNMIPDKEYYIEQVAVLLDTSRQKILWPCYDRLVEAGMGFAEAGYSFDTDLMKYYFPTNTYKNGKYYFDESTYMDQSPVTKSLMFFEPCSFSIGSNTYSVGEYQSTLGSLGNPIRMTGTVNVEIAAESQGFILTSDYHPEIGMILEKYDSSNNSWSTVSKGTTVRTPKGSYSIQIQAPADGGKGRITFNYQSSDSDPMDMDGSTYRIKFYMKDIKQTYVPEANTEAYNDPMTRVYNLRTGTYKLNESLYLKDLTSNADSGNYSFPLSYTDNGDDEGVIYFKLPEKEYPKMTFDSQGGTNVSEVRKLNTNTLGELPTTTRDGYIFVGWFTATSGGEQISKDYNCSRWKDDVTVYAHWEKIGTAEVSDVSLNFYSGAPYYSGTCYLSFTITAKGGSVQELEIPVNNLNLSGSESGMTFRVQDGKLIIRLDSKLTENQSKYVTLHNINFVDSSNKLNASVNGVAINQ